MILLPVALLLVLAPIGAVLSANDREQYQHYRVRRQAPTTSTTPKHKGDHEGTAFELYTWGDAEVYWGIPYAKAPVGNLTFAPPVDLDEGEEPKKIATGRGHHHEAGTYFGSPNCLTLDVFMPYREGENATVGLLPRLYPVLVFLHGGALLSGSSTDYGATGVVEQLVSHGIVVVMVQYRLGFLGYFNFRNHETPGTSLRGTYDQLAALRWVQRHIRDFQGDPKRVTLDGLFHQVLLMDGSIGTCSAASLSNRNIDKMVYEHVVKGEGGPEYDAVEAISAAIKWAEDNCRCDASMLADENCTENGVCSGSCSSKLEKQCLRPISETPLVYFFELRYPDGRLFKRPKEMLASAEKNAARAKFRIMAGVTRDGWAAFDRVIQEFAPGFGGDSSFIVKTIFNTLVGQKDQELLSDVVNAYSQAGLINLSRLYNENDTNNKAEWYWFYIRMMTDAVFCHPLLADLKAFHRLGHKIYPYHFALESPFGQDKSYYRYGPVSTHGMDIPYLFMPEQYFTLGLETNHNISEAALRAQVPIAEQIGILWARFIQAEDEQWFRDYSKESIFPYANMTTGQDGYFLINASGVAAEKGYPNALIRKTIYDFWHKLKEEHVKGQTGIAFMMDAVHTAAKKWIGGLIPKALEEKKKKKEGVEKEKAMGTTPPP